MTLSACETGPEEAVETTIPWWEMVSNPETTPSPAPTTVVTVPETSTASTADTPTPASATPVGTTPARPAAAAGPPPTFTPTTLYAPTDVRGVVEAAYNGGVKAWLDCYAALEQCAADSFRPYFNDVVAGQIGAEILQISVLGYTVEDLGLFHDRVVDILVDDAGMSALVRTCRFDPTRVVRYLDDGSIEIRSGGTGSSVILDVRMNLEPDGRWKANDAVQSEKPYADRIPC